MKTETCNPGPIDAFAGWHVSTGPRTDAGKGEVDLTTPDKKGGTEVYRWAWEINIAVRVDSEAPGKHRFPALAVAATMSLPSVRVAEEAVSLMRATKALGLEPGVGDADKQYWANSTTDRLHDDAIKEGFTPSTDYHVDRLGHQGGATTWSPTSSDVTPSPTAATIPEPSCPITSGSGPPYRALPGRYCERCPALTRSPCPTSLGFVTARRVSP